MQLKIAAVAIVLIAGGCASVEDIAARPSRGSATYHTTYDAMAYCLESQAAPLIRARARLYPTQRRATVAFTDVYGANTILLYEVRQIGEVDTEVTWKDPYRSSPDPDGREVPDRCAS